MKYIIDVQLVLIISKSNFEFQAKQSILDVKKQRLDVACEEVALSFFCCFFLIKLLFQALVFVSLF